MTERATDVRIPLTAGPDRLRPRATPDSEGRGTTFVTLMSYLERCMHLDAMRKQEARASHDYQVTLEQRIHALQSQRVALRAAADDLRASIANDLGD
jgi:UDP-N-acetylglucosamine enolpyruvyl transferase